MVQRERAGGLPAPVPLSETFQCRGARKSLPLLVRKSRRLCRTSLERLRPSWETGANRPFFRAPSIDGLGPRYSAVVLTSCELCGYGFHFSLARLAFAPTRPADRYRDVVTIQQAKKARKNPTHLPKHRRSRIRLPPCPDRSCSSQRASQNEKGTPVKSLQDKIWPKSRLGSTLFCEKSHFCVNFFRIWLKNAVVGGVGEEFFGGRRLRLDI